MSSLAHDALQQLKQRVETVWPDLQGDPQVYLGEDVAGVDFTRIQEPYSVVHVQPWKRNRGYGMDNNTFDSLVTVYYVRAIETTNDELRDKLWLLERYLDDPGNQLDVGGDYSGAMIEDVEDLGHDRYLPLNVEFEARGMPLRAGGVGVNVKRWEHCRLG